MQGELLEHRQTQPLHRQAGGTEQSMAGEGPEQVSVTFDDIAIHFTSEEWEYLEEWQKDLHKDVMWENYEALTSLGFQVARPVVPLKIELEVEPRTADPRGPGEAEVPRKRRTCRGFCTSDVLLKVEPREEQFTQDSGDSQSSLSSYTGSSTTSSRPSPQAASTDAGSPETTSNIRTRNPEVTASTAVDPVSAMTASTSGSPAYVNGTPGSVSSTSHWTLQSPTNAVGAPGTIVTSSRTPGTSTTATVAPVSTTHTTSRTLEIPVTAGGAPETNTRTLEASTTAAGSPRTSMGEIIPGTSMEERRTPRNSVEERMTWRNSVEERTSRNSVEERRTLGNSVGESRIPRNSTEESRSLRNSVVDNWTPGISSANRQKRQRRPPPALRLLLLQQKKIMRELQDMRRANEQLRRSVIQMVQEMRTRPEISASIPADAGSTPCQEIYLGKSTSPLDTELHFIPGPPLHTSYQHASRSAGSPKGMQSATNDFLSNHPPYAASRLPAVPQRRPRVVPFDSHPGTPPHSTSVPSSLTPQRQTRSMAFDFMPGMTSHNMNSYVSLPDASPRDALCIPYPMLENVKREPDTVMEHSVLLTPVPPPPRAPRRETHGQSLPDIPLARLTPEREAILLRHSKGEPHTLAKFLFQQHVPFHVYESWVHTTNFDGSRNKRAIPRNLQAEIMSFISSRFYLGEEDRKQIRDRINELLRMPRTGGWPVLS